MSCSSPLYALNLGVNPDNGKKIIKILPNRAEYSFKYLSDRYNTKDIVQLPCGKCFSCLNARAKAWAARCVLEASLYIDNAFITLTYDNNHYPHTFERAKRDFQLFMKRLRKINPGVRFFHCCEAGSTSGRLHHHAILFNWFPKDAKYLGASKYGGFRYLSNQLDALWSYGMTEVGEVSFSSAGYVARYTLKKLGSKGGDFISMSLKPGIGARYFEKHIKEIYDTDKIYFDFGSSKVLKPFRYFDKLFASIDEAKFDEIKTKRINCANVGLADRLFRLSFSNVEKLFKVDEAHGLYKNKILKRR